MQAIKIPVKTVTVPDWTALFELIKVGPVTVEDMDSKTVRAFNMWTRKYHKVNVKYVMLFGGGAQVALGTSIGSRSGGRNEVHS